MRALLFVTVLVTFLHLSAGIASLGEIDQTAVSSTALYLDNLITENLSKLQIIASTQEAVSGDWPGIKKYLMTIPNRLPGTWFYVMPDGNYYSLDSDLTGLNLRDRGYFGSLFEGKTVLGYPVFSRSSGKKSAVIASPIWVNGKVTGALGASLYLDDLHQRVNSDLKLGQEYTWFAVNSEGLTMLDMEADYIFMNAITESPASLKAAIEEALKLKEGEIHYELGELKRDGRFIKLPNLDWWLVMAKKGSVGESPDPQKESNLQDLTTDLQYSLERLNNIALKHMAIEEATWSSEPAIRKVLSAIIADSPLIVDVAWVDALGTMRYIEPSEYRNSEGVEIIKQPHVRQTLVEGLPVFSQSFMSAEGFAAVVIAIPVKNARSEILGAVSMLIRPELVIKHSLARMRFPSEAEVCVIDKAGRILFDDDVKEIGLLLFEDPLYKDFESLLKLGRQIVEQPSGKGEYVFEARGGTDKTVKAAVWDSVGIYDNQWRIIISRMQK